MSAYDAIFSDYEQEVLQLLPELERWWSEIAEIRRGRTTRGDRWTLGLSGHSRFIALYRKYALMILKLNDRIEKVDKDGGLTNPELWEKGETDPDEEVRTARPQAILIAGLIERHPEIRDHFRYFMYIPLGADDYGELYGEE